jgi:uncharacterized protein YdbL (DUF1318 family)
VPRVLYPPGLAKELEQLKAAVRGSYSGIPALENNLNSVHDTVAAMLEVNEVLTRQRGDANNSALLVGEADKIVTNLNYKIDAITEALAGYLQTVTIPHAFCAYERSPGSSNPAPIFGGISSLATAQPLDAVPTNIAATEGLGFILVVVNAGSDTDGTITVTGTSVDPDTGAQTGADTDNIVVSGLTTDGTANDGNGNPVYSFTNAYISSKLFTGAVTLSTADLTLTDVDVYHLSFTGLMDVPTVELDVLEADVHTGHVNAQLDGYLYSVVINGSVCDLSNDAAVNLGTNGVAVTANKDYRLRAGAIGKVLDGTKDGVFAEFYFSTSASYLTEFSMKLWAKLTV